MIEKMLPQNIEAEQGVLGSILIDPQAVGAAVSRLQSRDFYRDAHKVIFDAIISLYQQRMPVDFITICDELERQGKYQDAGEGIYITSLVNGVPTSGNVDYYADIVEDRSQLRDMIHACGWIVALIYEPGATAEDVLVKAQQKFFEIASKHRRGRGFIDAESLMAERMQQLEFLVRHRGQVIGVRTGFTALDMMTGGLQCSDLIVLAARPGIGKTSFALTLACNAAIKYKHKVAVFSLEMSKEQLGTRLLSYQAGIDQQRMRLGWVEEDEWGHIVEASDTIAASGLWIDDTSGITSTELRSKALQLQEEQGVDLIIVDYLQLMQTGTSKKFENRVQEVSEITRSLKGLARELNVPVLALSQLSRAVESRQSKVPQLSDLRESGSIEQDSDIVMFIYRDDVYNPESERKNIADLIVAKHRNGPQGEISLYFDACTTSFRNLETTIGE